MSPWILLAFDVIAACLAVGGITLIVRSLATRHLSFAARVAQGRVQEDPTPEITRWLKRMGAAALDSLGSTRDSVARRLILAGAAPEVSVFRLRQAAAAIAGLLAACLVLTARPAASLRAWGWNSGSRRDTSVTACPRCGRSPRWSTAPTRRHSRAWPVR